MCMLLGMSKQLVYAFPGFYNETILVVGVFQTVRVSQKGHRVSSFPSFCPFVGDSANISSVRRSGGKVFLSTIQHMFYPGRQTS